jgi:hypothetical protein
MLLAWLGLAHLACLDLAIDLKSQILNTCKLRQIHITSKNNTNSAINTYSDTHPASKLHPGRWVGPASWLWITLSRTIISLQSLSKNPSCMGIIKCNSGHRWQATVGCGHYGTFSRHVEMLFISRNINLYNVVPLSDVAQEKVKWLTRRWGG